MIDAMRKLLAGCGTFLVFSCVLCAQVGTDADRTESLTPIPPAETATPQGVVDATLAALSGPVGAPRDWRRYRSLFDPTAQLVSTSTNDKGQTKITRWNLDSYQESADEYLVKTGFIDRKLACSTTRFGNIATVRCGFEGLEQLKLVERGVAMFQLFTDGKRWWIISVIWDLERPGNPIPSELLATAM
jgi:hypothetical protein